MTGVDLLKAFSYNLHRNIDWNVTKINCVTDVWIELNKQSDPLILYDVWKYFN